MFAGVVSAASGTWHVPVIAPAVIVQENAVGEFKPPPPVANAIGIPDVLTGVKVTVPDAIGTPPILIEVAVRVVSWACASVEPNAHNSAAAALSRCFIVDSLKLKIESLEKIYQTTA
jgi:hypothetical protein